MPSVLCIVGTRPEAIKMAPVIHALAKTDWAKVTTMVTGQHSELLQQALETFAIRPEADLKVMTQGQSLNQLTARLFERLEPAIKNAKPDIVLGQGDTTTVMVTAVTCFYLKIAFGHVEAGLRSGDLDNPFPEEMNRIVARVAADLHFAPTQRAANALRSEGADDETIVLTGNTVIDALHLIKGRTRTLPWPKTPGARVILLTAHRRENFGEPIARVLTALRNIVERHCDVELVFPVHPNPAVQSAARDILGNVPRVHLTDPLPYEAFVSAMRMCHLVVSDSGGVQEEAPAFGKPVLVIREETERWEAIEAGVAKLIGTSCEAVESNVARLLSDRDAYRAMARGVSPYGDGYAAARIVDAMEAYLGLSPRRRLGDFRSEHANLFEVSP